MICSLSQVKSTVVKTAQHFYQKVSQNPIVPSKILRQASFFYLQQQTIIDGIKIMIVSGVFVTSVKIKLDSKY